MRQPTNAIACQSRTARGVRLQRLDADDAIVDVTLVPAAIEETVITTEVVPIEEISIAEVTLDNEQITEDIANNPTLEE
jgi:DNA gyrase subunit A